MLWKGIHCDFRPSVIGRDRCSEIPFHKGFYCRTCLLHRQDAIEMSARAFEFDQRFPIKFKLSGPAANLGARHGLSVLEAQQYYSGGCLVGRTTVKGGMSFV